MAVPTTYDEAEKHEFEGSPVELYLFSQGGNSWWWTSSETPASDFGGDEYLPYPISRTEIEQSQEDKTGALEVKVPQDNPIAQMFAQSVPVLPIHLIIYRTHRVLGVGSEDLQAVIFTGKVSAVTFSGGEATISCLPVSAVLRKMIPWPTYQSQCNWALYSASCGVIQNNYETSVVVENIGMAPQGYTIESADVDALDDGYFTGGFVVREINNDVKMISWHAGPYIALMSPFNNPPLEVGETVLVYAGCDRQHTTCLAKFNNLDNFMGFPFVPLKNPYVGSIA